MFWGVAPNHKPQTTNHFRGADNDQEDGDGLPVKGDVEVVQIEDSLEAMQALVGGMVEEIWLPMARWKKAYPGWAASPPKDSRVSLYVNEEGLRLDLRPNATLTTVFGDHVDSTLVGDGFLGATGGADLSSLTEAEIAFWSGVIRNMT